MRLASALAGLALLGACQTAPDPCTSEWVEWRTESVLTSFARGHLSEVRRLRDFSETLQEDEIGPLVALQIPGMIEDFKILAAAFEADVMPELNAAIEQCGGTQELAPAFIAFLEKEGVGEDVLEWVELLSAFVVES